MSSPSSRQADGERGGVEGGRRGEHRDEGLATQGPPDGEGREDREGPCQISDDRLFGSF